MAGPLESWPVATGSLGTGLSGVVTLVAGRCVGLGEFVVIWPTGTTLKATRARLALTSDRKSLRLGATIHAGRELAGLTEADQIELARLIPCRLLSWGIGGEHGCLPISGRVRRRRRPPRSQPSGSAANSVRGDGSGLAYQRLGFTGHDLWGLLFGGSRVSLRVGLARVSRHLSCLPGRTLSVPALRGATGWRRTARTRSCAKPTPGRTSHR